MVKIVLRIKLFLFCDKAKIGEIPPFINQDKITILPRSQYKTGADKFYINPFF